MFSLAPFLIDSFLPETIAPPFAKMTDCVKSLRCYRLAYENMSLSGREGGKKGSIYIEEQKSCVIIVIIFS
jgi:hypothetical protein